MYFYRTRRSCVLVSSVIIALPLYVLIYLLYNSETEFYDKPKVTLRKLFDNTLDNLPRNDQNDDVPDFLKNISILIEQESVTISIDISKGELLQEIDTADVAPKRELSARQIFFVETSHPEGGYLDINAREACAIESAAMLHPEYKIYVLFAGKIVIHPESNRTKLVRNLFEAYPNIYFRRIDPSDFSKDTPMETFFKSGRIDQSKHLSVHLADILRLVALWKYGGLYFDLDVVVVKNLAELGENFLGATTNKMLMSGTMQFSGTGIGHKFVEECLEDVAKNYKGGTWAGNGPDVVTRTMKIFCDTVWVNEMTEDRCKGMKVLERDLLLPIWYPSHKMYFASAYAKLTDKLIENSYTAHIFNHMNHHLKLFKGGKAVYLTLAEKYCPVVYGTLDVGDPF